MGRIPCPIAMGKGPSLWGGPPPYPVARGKGPNIWGTPILLRLARGPSLWADLMYSQYLRAESFLPQLCDGPWAVLDHVMQHCRYVGLHRLLTQHDVKWMQDVYGAPALSTCP